VEILGSGLGRSTLESLFAGIGQFLQAFPKARFRIATEAHPLSEVEHAWGAVAPEKRLVFTVP
jgi:hypothetical protein